MKDLDHIEPTLRLKTAIASCRFFSMLTEREAAGLAAAVALRQFGKGETIYREADPADKAWLVLAGTVKLLKAGREVRPLLVEIMVPQDMFGAVCHSARRLYPTAAITMEDCLLLALPCEALEKVLGSNAWFQRTLLADFCQRLCHAQQMRSLAHQAAFCRIAGVLAYLHSKFGRDIPHTRAILAEMAGTTVETAIRVTRQLARGQVIATERGRIVILNAAKLTAGGIWDPTVSPNDNGGGASEPLRRAPSKES